MHNPFCESDSYWHLVLRNQLEPFSRSPNAATAWPCSLFCVVAPRLFVRSFHSFSPASGLDCFSIFWFVKRKNALFRQNVDVNYVSNCEFHVNNTSNFPILQSIVFDKMLILYRKCPSGIALQLFFSKLPEKK